MNAPHLVLVPGLDGTGQLFEPLREALPESVNTSVVGFPHDRALNDPDLFACIRNVIPWDRRFVILGESTSGPIAMRFAAAQSENVSAVILVSSFVSDPMAASSNWATAFLTRPWFEKPVTPASVRKHLLGRQAPDALVTRTVHALRTPWPEVLGHRIELMQKRDARNALQNWPKPVLYLQATDDAFVTPHSAAEITNLNPGAQVVSVPGPHLLLQTNPQGAAQAIMTFLENHLTQGNKAA